MSRVFLDEINNVKFYKEVLHLSIIFFILSSAKYIFRDKPREVSQTVLMA
ncbi:hypothetical protein CONCODRAFT_14076 [Conidiobolus coronatus NRRL 28638]|uniref:Uncharacterized protein n=1 Tax=Conidiobolus coronatus (strain ATCC 28846 / CBS 209.66 / NRRL 28638) TaxID=796925 RepID=A0A137NPQ8_CONC2|nr:hypothetical protein CONCODRAFT_14076 [Conidiobolus coronatus NRRL 28638]|eukprot:KXN64711.1 hypothetical protein CONCODRAFT_14076 [Conidiobolus coronatus NRRL 28638]